MDLVRRARRLAWAGLRLEVTRYLAPMTLETPHGPTTVARVGLWVDEPREVAEALRRRLSAPLR